jgi:hypothetical protein
MLFIILACKRVSNMYVFARTVAVLRMAFCHRVGIKGIVVSSMFMNSHLQLTHLLHE